MKFIIIIIKIYKYISNHTNKYLHKKKCIKKLKTLKVNKVLHQISLNPHFPKKYKMITNKKDIHYVKHHLLMTLQMNKYIKRLFTIEKINKMILNSHNNPL